MKPVSSSTKDWLVSLTAKELDVEEALVNKIISWSYLKAKEATEHVRSIELSGFGKLLLSPTKTKKRILTREKSIQILKGRLINTTEEATIDILNKSIITMEKDIEWLKTKLENEDSMERSVGGVA